ncbi:acyl-CoA thioesterase [bacterium]|nr:acyl-CoA thioesterase [bacterium]MBU1074248.1 acyl-CoA thioesterase [bacterium]MBU1676626.1 acyl-CoA thioesterase [bacterium]
MPSYSRDVTVRLRDTDAAGVIYFTSLLVFAHETFERYLDACERPLGRQLAEDDDLLPIVHCEADYRRGVTVGDRLTVEMAVDAIGESSFTLAYTLRRNGDEVGRCRIVHASLGRRSLLSVPLPAVVRDHLRELSGGSG